MSRDGTGMPEGSEHDWVGRVLAADSPGPIPPAVGSRIEDSLRAAAGATFSGERPQVFGGSSPARPSPFSAVPPVRRSAGPADGDDAAGGSSPGRRSGSRRGLRDEAAQDRRHRLLYKLLPAAAAVVVVAGSAAVAVTVIGGGDDSATGGTTLEAAAGPEAGGPVPNGLVATGTSYTEGDLGPLALGLVSDVGTGEAGTAAAAEAEPVEEALDADEAGAVDEGGSDVAGDESVPADAASDPVGASPLASAAAFRACAQALGAPEGVLPVAIDLATFEGTEAAVVVLPNRAGDGYEVIVTDRACNPATQRAAATVLAP